MFPVESWGSRKVGESFTNVTVLTNLLIMQMFWTVQRIKATSPLGDPRVTYSLEEGLVPETNMPVRFYLTPNRYDGSASILVAELLDYETTKNFLLRVRAQNVAAVPLAAFTTIYINITGVWVLQWSHNLNMFFFFFTLFYTFLSVLFLML